MDKEIPGYQKDPNTGRYFKIPSASAPPSQRLKLVTPDSVDKGTVFNQIPTKIRLPKGTGHCKKANFGITQALVLQETGSVNSFQFEMETRKHRLRQLECVDVYYVFEQVFSIGSCEYVVDNGSTCIGIWTEECGNIAGSNVVGEVNISYGERKKYLPISESYVSGLYYNNQIADTCAVDINDLKFALILTNGIRENVIHFCPRRSGLAYLPESRFGYESRTYAINTTDVLRCCSWNRESNAICYGSNKGIYHTNCYNSFKRVQSGIDVLGLEFNNSGNSIFSTMRDGSFSILDLRNRNTSRVAELGRGIVFMKPLADDHSLIASGFNNKLEMVDLRMKKVVFSYPGHQNSHKKIPFHFDENVNILCSSGHDKVTRLWNLTNGKPLASIDAPHNKNSCIFSSFQVINGEVQVQIFNENKVHYYNSLKYGTTKSNFSIQK